MALAARFLHRLILSSIQILYQRLLTNKPISAPPLITEVLFSKKKTWPLVWRHNLIRIENWASWYWFMANVSKQRKRNED